MSCCSKSLLVLHLVDEWLEEGVRGLGAIYHLKLGLRNYLTCLNSMQGAIHD